MTRRFPVQDKNDGVDTKPSSTANQTKTKTVIIPGEHGLAFRVPAGSKFRVTDLYGEQIIDFLAWVDSSPRPQQGRTSDTETQFLSLPMEHLSVAQTRYHHRGVMPNIGEAIYTNAAKPMFKVLQDTVKCHDMTFPCCSPEMYRELLGREKGDKHRSCASNIAGAVTRLLREENHAQDFEAHARVVGCCNTCHSPILNGDDSDKEPTSSSAKIVKDNEMDWKVHHLQVHEPFNIFQNTPYYTLKPFGNSKPGDHIDFEVMTGAIVSLSCCPFDIDNLNGGKSTDVEVCIEYDS